MQERRRARPSACRSFMTSSGRTAVSPSACNVGRCLGIRAPFRQCRRRLRGLENNDLETEVGAKVDRPVGGGVVEETALQRVGFPEEIRGDDADGNACVDAVEDVLTLRRETELEGWLRF